MDSIESSREWRKVPSLENSLRRFVLVPKFSGEVFFFFFFFYNSRNILVIKVKTHLRKSYVRDRSLFMWGGGGDFFCFSMKEKT